MWPCCRPQGLSPKSTRFKCWASHRELLRQAKGKWNFSSLVLLQHQEHQLACFRVILHKWQLVQLMINECKLTTILCIRNANLTLASQLLLNSCAQILNIWDPEHQKNYLYQRVKSYPYGILLLFTTSWPEFDPITSSRYYSLSCWEEKMTRNNRMKFRLTTSDTLLIHIQDF